MFALTLSMSAQSPHFSRVVAALRGENVVVSFKEAGLGNNQLISYTASANGTAIYACINNGGKNPSAANKVSVNGPVSASALISSGKNGTVTGSVTISPVPSENFCPNGQTFILAYVSYSGIRITDTTNNVYADTVPSSFSSCRVEGNLAAELCP